MSDPLAALRKAPGIVRLHGHRGARGVLPENTLIGFQNTFDIGIDVVELDVLTTADDVPVITHNPRLMAASTRGATGRWLEELGPAIRDLTLAELQGYDVGGLRRGTKYAAQYPDQAFLNDQRIPALAELAEIASRPRLDGVWLNIEIKSNPCRPEFTPPLPDYVAGILTVLDRFRLSGRVVVQSFDWRVLREVAEQDPDLPRSYLSFLDQPNAPMVPNIIDGSDWMAGASRGDAGGSLPDLIADLGGAAWSPYHANIRADEVARAQARGLIVNAWTVNSTGEIQAAIDAGVDGLITDYPARAQSILVAQGLTWRG